MASSARINTYLFSAFAFPLKSASSAQPAMATTSIFKSSESELKNSIFIPYDVARLYPATPDASSRQWLMVPSGVAAWTQQAADGRLGLTNGSRRDGSGQHGLQFAAVDQRLQLARTADQRALDEHHREGGPAGPHLQRAARAPHAEVAVVLEVFEWLPLRFE